MTNMFGTKDFYVAVMKNGEVVEFASLEMLKAINYNDTICFLKGAYVYSAESSTPSFFHQFLLITQDGNYTTYYDGDYEIVAIGPDKGYDIKDPYFRHRQITFRNLVTDEYYTYRSKVPYEKFFKKEIIPLMHQLNECDSKETIEETIKNFKPHE